MMKDTWTVHGDYKMFVIYAEDLDAPETAPVEPVKTTDDDNE